MAVEMDFFEFTQICFDRLRLYRQSFDGVNIGVKSQKLYQPPTIMRESLNPDFEL